MIKKSGLLAQILILATINSFLVQSKHLTKLVIGAIKIKQIERLE